MAKQKSASREISMSLWLRLFYASSGLDEEQLRQLLDWLAKPIDGVRLTVHETSSKAIALAIDGDSYRATRHRVLASLREFEAVHHWDINFSFIEDN